MARRRRVRKRGLKNNVMHAKTEEFESSRLPQMETSLHIPVSRIYIYQWVEVDAIDCDEEV